MNGAKSRLKFHSIFEKFQDEENIKCTLKVKCKNTIKQMFKMLNKKISNVLSSSFYYLLRGDN